MERLKNVRTVCLTSMLSIAALAGTPARTQTLLSDELRITDGGGKVVKDMKILETATTPESIGIHKVAITGIATLFDPTLYGKFLALYDSGPVVRISDVVGIYATKTASGVVLNFGFASDNEQLSPSLNKFIAPGIAPHRPFQRRGLSM